MGRKYSDAFVQRKEAQFIAYYVDYMVSRFEPDSDLNVRKD
jgi:hypothetical protein